MSWEIREGDVREKLRELPDESVQCCVTSPPYWGLRDYGTAEWEGGDPECDHRQALGGETDKSTKQATNAGTQGYQYRDVCAKCGATRVDGQLGLEPTPEQYVANMVEVFREVRRVLRDDGTLWLNLGDSYTSGGRDYRAPDSQGGSSGRARAMDTRPDTPAGLKPKDLVGIPWMVAFALRADGWYLRSDIIWAKPNPMPESVTDRPTKAHEYLFLLSKSARYFYDAEAIKEKATDALPHSPGKSPHAQGFKARSVRDGIDTKGGGQGAGALSYPLHTRNKRSVWTVATRPYSEAHFATYPPDLVEPCISAGTPPKCCGECGAPWGRVVVSEAHCDREPTRGEGYGMARRAGGRNMADRDGGFGQIVSTTLGREPTCDHDDDTGRAVVLDPFNGAGTTGLVATQLGRDYIGVELNPEYADMARRRIERWEANPSGALKGDPEPIDGQASIFDALEEAA